MDTIQSQVQQEPYRFKSPPKKVSPSNTHQQTTGKGTGHYRQLVSGPRTAQDDRGGGGGGGGSGIGIGIGSVNLLQQESFGGIGRGLSELASLMDTLESKHLKENNNNTRDFIANGLKSLMGELNLQPDAEYKDIKASMIEEQVPYSLLHRALRELIAERQACAQEVQDTKGRFLEKDALLQAEMHHVQATNQALAEKLRATENNLQKAMGKVGELKRKKRGLKEMLQEERESVHTLLKQKLTTENLLDTSNAKISTLTQVSSIYESKLADATDKLLGLTKQRALLENKSNIATVSYENKISNLSKANQERKEAIERSSAEIADMGRQNQTLRGQLAAAQEQLNHLTERVAARHQSELKAIEASKREKQTIEAPTGVVTLVFTDVQGSTAQWEANPEIMTIALDIHFKIMREMLRSAGGYECKTEGDAFMIAFQSPLAAVHWCMFVQEALLVADWPPALLNNEHSKEQRSPDGRVLFRGLRVRIGVHTGTPQCHLDPVSKRMDYFGPMVNRAARVAGLPHGGQVVVSGRTWREIEADLSGVEVVHLGEFALKGIKGSEQIVQILPSTLTGRKFPPLQTSDVKEPHFETDKDHPAPSKERDLKETKTTAEEDDLGSQGLPPALGKIRSLATRYVPEGTMHGEFQMVISEVERQLRVAWETADELRLSKRTLVAKLTDLEGRLASTDELEAEASEWRGTAERLSQERRILEDRLASEHSEKEIFLRKLVETVPQKDKESNSSRKANVDVNAAINMELEDFLALGEREKAELLLRAYSHIRTANLPPFKGGTKDKQPPSHQSSPRYQSPRHQPSPRQQQQQQSQIQPRQLLLQQQVQLSPQKQRQPSPQQQQQRQSTSLQQQPPPPEQRQSPPQQHQQQSPHQHQQQSPRQHQQQSPRQHQQLSSQQHQQQSPQQQRTFPQTKSQQLRPSPQTQPQQQLPPPPTQPQQTDKQSLHKRASVNLRNERSTQQLPVVPNTREEGSKPNPLQDADSTANSAQNISKNVSLPPVPINTVASPSQLNSRSTPTMLPNLPSSSTSSSHTSEPQLPAHPPSQLPSPQNTVSSLAHPPPRSPSPKQESPPELLNSSKQTHSTQSPDQRQLSSPSQTVQLPRTKSMTENQIQEVDSLDRDKNQVTSSAKENTKGHDNQPEKHVEKEALQKQLVKSQSEYIALKNSYLKQIGTLIDRIKKLEEMVALLTEELDLYRQKVLTMGGEDFVAAIQEKRLSGSFDLEELEKYDVKSKQLASLKEQLQAKEADIKVLRKEREDMATDLKDLSDTAGASLSKQKSQKQDKNNKGGSFIDDKGTVFIKKLKLLNAQVRKMEADKLHDESLRNALVEENIHLTKVQDEKLSAVNTQLKFFEGQSKALMEQNASLFKEKSNAETKAKTLELQLKKFVQQLQGTQKLNTGSADTQESFKYYYDYYSTKMMGDNDDPDELTREGLAQDQNGDKTQEMIREDQVPDQNNLVKDHVTKIQAEYRNGKSGGSVEDFGQKKMVLLRDNNNHTSSGTSSDSEAESDLSPIGEAHGKLGTDNNDFANAYGNDYVEHAAPLSATLSISSKGRQPNQPRDIVKSRDGIKSSEDEEVSGWALTLAEMEQEDYGTAHNPMKMFSSMFAKKGQQYLNPILKRSRSTIAPSSTDFIISGHSVNHGH